MTNTDSLIWSQSAEINKIATYKGVFQFKKTWKLELGRRGITYAGYFNTEPDTWMRRRSTGSIATTHQLDCTGKDLEIAVLLTRIWEVSLDILLHLCPSQCEVTSHRTRVVGSFPSIITACSKGNTPAVLWSALIPMCDEKLDMCLLLAHSSIKRAFSQVPSWHYTYRDCSSSDWVMWQLKYRSTSVVCDGREQWFPNRKVSMMNA